MLTVEGLKSQLSPDLGLASLLQDDPEFDGEMPDDSDGILILSLKELFAKVRDQSISNFMGSPDGQDSGATTRVYMIRCSYFEIYNDAVYDLLNTQKEVAFNEPL